MHPRQCLQQNHTEAYSLQCIQNTEPQPQTARDECSGCVAAGPGEVETGAGDTPPDLSPARGSETAGENGEDPGVRFGEVAEEEEEDGPDSAEEDYAKDADLPGVHVLGAPENCSLLVFVFFLYALLGRRGLQLQLRPYGALRNQFWMMTTAKFQRMILRLKTDL